MAETSVGDVVREFRTVIGIIDEAAATAERAAAEARQAHAEYSEASRGTDHRSMRKAVVETRTAAEKAGKTARLLSEAAEHFTAYVNVIAPGTAPPRSSAPEAMPDGERTTTEAMERRTRATSFLDRTARRVDDVKDAVAETTKAVEEGTKVALRHIKGGRPPSGGPASTTTSTSHPAPAQHPPAHETASTVVVAALGAALVGRATVDYLKKRHRTRKQEDEDKK